MSERPDVPSSTSPAAGPSAASAPARRDPFTAIPDEEFHDADVLRGPAVPGAADVHGAGAQPGAAPADDLNGAPDANTPLTAGGASSAGAPASGASTARDADAPREWWDDPSLPWRHKPTSTDKWCMAWVVFMGLFGLALLPFRAWMLARSPWVLVSLTGSRSGTSALGALARTGGTHMWWLALVFGSLMSIKFDWVFWWAGKLWGHGMIEVWAGRSARSQRTYARAERWAQKFGWIGMFLAYVPIPLPLMQVIFVLAGAEQWSLKKFLALDFVSSTLWLAGYFTLGWIVGAPAVDLLKLYARVAQYVSIGLVVFIVAGAMLRSRRPAAS